MFITFKKWTALYVATILALFAIFAAILWQGNAVNASKNLELKQNGEFILIIDPGHGGFDPARWRQMGLRSPRLTWRLACRWRKWPGCWGWKPT